MTAAPGATDPTELEPHSDADTAAAPPPRPGGSQSNRRLLAAFTSTVVVIAAIAVVSGLVIRSEPAESTPLTGPPATVGLDSADPTALAGARRIALAASTGLRAASAALSGFTDAALLTEVDAAVAALDTALAGTDADAILTAHRAHLAARADLVARVADDADARLAGSGSAEAPIIDAARAAIAAVRTAAPDAVGEAFARMRAAVEQAAASHAAALAAAAAEETGAPGDRLDRSTAGATGGTAGTVDPCRPVGIIQDDQDSMPCEPDLVVTALGSYVGSCPPGTFSHAFEMRGRQVGSVTLSYPFDYTYSIASRHNLAIFHCDPAGGALETPPHGPGPLTAP